MRNFLNKPEIPVSQAFRDYLTYGGFPKSLEYDDPDAKAAYIQDVIGQIFNKDITAHKKVRNRDTFTRVQDYLINNFAAPTNLSGIIAYLKHSEGISIKRETLASYVRLLESAKILYKCPRFDLKSRKSLRGGEKYYLADPRYPVRPVIPIRESATVRHWRTRYIRICGRKAMTSASAPSANLNVTSLSESATSTPISKCL